MRWAWRAIALAGIPVYIHATFWLLLVWVGIAHFKDGGGVADALSAVGFVVAIFFCVLLHELGHALTARRFGIKTHDIILLPLGGVARLERMPEKPSQEIGVALAGPAVNVVIAMALAVLIGIERATTEVQEVGTATGGLLVRLLVVNLFLALFNLLPAFPMDGGRVLRALLALKFPYEQATWIAARIGQGMALLFGIVGLLFDPILMLIAFFIWTGAGQEALHVASGARGRSGGGEPPPEGEPRHHGPRYDAPREEGAPGGAAGPDLSKLAGVVVREAMLAEFRFLEADSPLAAAAEIAREGRQFDFLIAESGRFLGVVDGDSLAREIASRGTNVPLRSITKTGVVPAAPDEPVTDLLARMRKAGTRALPVVDRGRIVGIVSESRVLGLLG